MKKLTLLLFILCIIASGLSAQRMELSDPLSIDGTLNKKYQNYPKGSQVKLLKVIKMKNRQDDPSLNGIVMAVDINGVQTGIPIEEHKIIDFQPQTKYDFWQCTFLHHDMFQYYEGKGYNYDLRQELTDETNDYLKNLSGLFYEDAYIEDYVQSIFALVDPRQVNNKRPEVLNMRIVKSPAPDAYMLPNGTMLISTGLLTTLDSKEELTAIIASEMAHYILDHQVANTLKAQNRARRAEFWSTVAAGFLEGLDQSLSYRYEHYIPGTTLVGAELICALINSNISNRLGMTYTRKQEAEADRIAQEFLAFNQMDPAALSSALTKIKSYYETEHDYYNLSRFGNFAELDERISKLKEPKEFKNHSYQKAMAGVITFNAMLQQANKYYEAAQRLAHKNIENKVASDDDYLVLAKSNMALFNTPEANAESMRLLQKAKDIAKVPNLNIYKQEILLYLRMDKQAKAANHLKEYMDMLSQYQQQVHGSNEANWAAEELGWAQKLLQRIELF